jgi:hypothetical protein
VRRLLSLLMIVTLVVGYGSSVSAAICQHRDFRAHAAARASHDGRIASAALGEEAAASVDSKKGAPSDSRSVSGPIDMVAPPDLALPRPMIEGIRRHVTDDPALAGTSVRPLLPPPLA